VIKLHTPKLTPKSKAMNLIVNNKKRMCDVTFDNPYKNSMTNINPTKKLKLDTISSTKESRCQR